MSSVLEIPDFGNHIILIIDDSPTNLGVLADYLEDYEFDILVAEDGESGVDKAQYAQPDIILLDVMMPGIDGFETCRRLKANEATKNIPVVFMTALTETEHKVKGFEAGAVDYVTKPLHQEEVLARVNTHLKIRDLTNNLQKANKTLSKMNADKDKFLSIMAHDLKGPFLPLLGMSELLPKLIDMGSTTKVKEMSIGIHRSAQNAYNLLENLLQWSRLQMGRMDYNPERVDLTDIVARNIHLLAETATYKNITLESQLNQLILVHVDEYMLDTIVRNLTSNALKFTPHGGRVTIGATISENPEFIELFVADTGVGISEEDMAKLFRLETHHTTIGTANEQGTGLGLIMCQEMVRQNKGELSAESNVGQGTTFRFTIPLDASAEITNFTNDVPLNEVVDETPELIPPPVAEIQKLYDLATIGNMYALEEKATRIGQTDEQFQPFSQRLCELAKGFEDEEILTLLEQFM